LQGNNTKKLNIKYPTIKEIVLNDLREDLLSGKLVPEQVLNINDLSEKYNVSQTPIREALNNLESMGLVERINHKCIKVAKFLSDEVHEIYYMRAALSGLSAKLSARNMNLEEKQRLLDIVKESAKILNDKDADAFLNYNREFHNSMAKYIKTPLIKNINEQFYIITVRYRVLGLEVRIKEQLLQEHELIAKAVFEGDEEKAEYYGRMHYVNTIKFLDKSNAK
jgi:DNA-binding GntR family transcriptional regulator